LPRMTAIVVLSHGSLSKGLVEAACMIAGKSSKLEYVCLEEGEGPENFRRKVDAVLNTFSEDDVLFLVDLFGGTPSNIASMLFLERAQADTGGQTSECPKPPVKQGSQGEVAALASDRRRSFALVTGVNLGMLLEAINNRANMRPDELASHLVKVSPATIVDLGRVLLEGVRKPS